MLFQQALILIQFPLYLEFSLELFFSILQVNFWLNNLRRWWDLNSRYLSVCRFSKPVLSTTQPHLPDYIMLNWKLIFNQIKKCPGFVVPGLLLSVKVIFFSFECRTKPDTGNGFGYKELGLESLLIRTKRHSWSSRDLEVSEIPAGTALCKAVWLVHLSFSFF